MDARAGGMHRRARSLIVVLAALAPGASLLADEDGTPPPAQVEPGAPAAESRQEPGAVETFLADDANVVGLITAGSGVVGGLGVCALVALSPTCCALPMGFPIAAATTGAGAAVAAAVMSDWSCGRMWLPALAGLFLGATSGLFASIAGLITWTVVGSAVGVSTFDPAAANTSTLLLVSAAGAATLGVAVLGAALTGTLVRFMYALTDEREGSRSDPPRQRPPRRRGTRAPTGTPAPGFEY